MAKGNIGQARIGRVSSGGISSFRKANNLKDVKNRMEKLGVKLGFRKDNLDKFSLEQANMILEALENSPMDITDSLEVMTIQKMKEKGYFPRDARYKPLQMNGVSKGDTIGFNYMKMKNLEKKKLERNKEGNIFFNTSTKAMIHHELGHRFGDKRGLATSDEWNKIAKRWTTEQPYKSTAGRKSQGFSNDFTYKEAFAEGYAAYKTGNKKLPKYVKDYFKRETSRKVSYEERKDSYGNKYKVFKVK